MLAEAGVLGEVWIGEQRCPLAFRVVGLQVSQTVVGQVGLPLSRVEQEEVVVGLITLFEVGLVVDQPEQLLH